MAVDVEILKKVTYFAGFTAAELEQVSKTFFEQSFKRGEIVSLEGEKADNVYLIAKGKVKVYKTDKQGNETTLAIIEKGNLFGEMALFDQGLRSASVMSIEVCQLYIFEGDRFLELVVG